jgi:cbb3-type cytochrome oxidase subunit 3
MKKSEEKKKMITTGIIRWWRFIIAPVVFLVTANMIQEGTYSSWKILIILLLSGIFYLLWKHRRLKFDNKNLYIKRGKAETTVPLTNIVSIKRSRTKVNGGRYWILIYLDQLNEERKLRFDSDFDKEFHDMVKENNPEVVIWTHPFFNH